MAPAWPFAGTLLAGPLCSTAPWPYHLYAHCCDLQSCFRVKLSIRSGCRAIARNGRILLCADRPMEQLTGRLVCVRLQTWHRIYLPGDAPQAHGILLCTRCLEEGAKISPLFTMSLRPDAQAIGELRIEVGGRRTLDFCTRS